MHVAIIVLVFLYLYGFLLLTSNQTLNVDDVPRWLGWTILVLYGPLCVLIYAGHRTYEESVRIYRKMKRG